MVDDRMEAKKKGKTIQPSIHIVGKLTCIDKILVVADDQKHITHDFVDAVDLLIEMYQVFDICYPNECAAIYTFFQKSLFGISHRLDCLPVKSICLLKKLNIN